MVRGWMTSASGWPLPSSRSGAPGWRALMPVELVLAVEPEGVTDGYLGSRVLE